jgi:DNA-binding transcriptional MerR regulator
VGLLKPIERSTANYRLHSDESLNLLKKICLFREVGVGLKDIGVLISTSDNDDVGTSVLEDTLFQLNCHIKKLQEKQRVIVNMIKIRKGGHANGTTDEQMLLDTVDQIPSFAFNIDKALGIDIEEIGK